MQSWPSAKCHARLQLSRKKRVAAGAQLRSEKRGLFLTPQFSTFFVLRGAAGSPWKIVLLLSRLAKVCSDELRECESVTNPSFTRPTVKPILLASVQDIKLWDMKHLY